MHPSTKLRALAALAALAAACAGAMTPRDIMMQSIREYNEGLRWGKLDVAASRMPFAARQRFAERWNELGEDVPILDYDILRIDVGQGNSSATVRVELSWMNQRRGIVERTLFEEEWVEKRGWAVVKQRRLKGTPFPPIEDEEPPAASAAAPSPPL